MLSFNNGSYVNVALYTLIILLQFLLIFSYATRHSNATFTDESEASRVIPEIFPNKSRIPFSDFTPKPSGERYSTALVIGHMQSEDLSWVQNELPDMQTVFYTVDDASANHSVPANKGHEAMAYLTYIVDNYYTLPDVVLFFHAGQFQWHNNDLHNGNSADMIRTLKLARVARRGYFNMRCDWFPGCPDWIHMDRPAVDDQPNKKSGEKHFTPGVWRELFPAERMPPALAQPCCAQFAVSAARIRENPREQYLHLRQWLIDTAMDDYNSGRVFEYIWQYLFTRNAQHCPAEHTCYCDGYGLCFGGEVQYLKFKGMQAEIAYLEGEMQRMEQHEFWGDGDAIKEKKHRIELLVEERDRKLREAWERGELEENRAVEAERIDEAVV